jgi:hypothetical protein
MIRTILLSTALLSLAACASYSTAEGQRFNYRCDGDKAFSYRRVPNAIEVFAAGQTIRLEGADGAYTNGTVSYAESGGRGTLTGANGGPYDNCRRRGGGLGLPSLPKLPRLW